MKPVNLCLHAGAKRVDRNEIAHANTPEATLTHQPIPHALLLDNVTSTLAYHGYDVTSEAHGLTTDGARYFGILQLSNASNDHTIVVGVRNSHDKRFPAGIAAGSHVFCCDNLAFSGEIKLARKHTRYFLRDLPSVVHRAVTKLGSYYAGQAEQFDRFKQMRLTDDRARSLIVEAVKRDVIGCTHLPSVLKEWETPSHDQFGEPTLWRLYNAVTEVAKSWSGEQLFRRTQLLHGLCNAEVGLAV